MTYDSMHLARGSLLCVALLSLSLAGCASSSEQQSLADNNGLVRQGPEVHLYAFLDNGRGGFDRIR
jgi:hypothetical protein